MSMLREIGDKALRALLGAMCFTKAGLAIGTTTTAFKTANTSNYAIDGVLYTKAATDNIVLTAHPTSGVTGAFVTHGPSQSRYYAVLIDAAGNITTKQGANNGPIPSPGGGYESNPVAGYPGNMSNSPVYPLQAGTVSSISNAYPAVVTTSANHLRQTGDTVRLDCIPTQATLAGQQPLSSLNGRVFKIKRLSATTFSLFTLEGMPVDTRIMAAFGTGTGSWIEDTLARSCIGAILVTTDSSTTFTPGTTALSAAGLTTTYFDLPFVPLMQMP